MAPALADRNVAAIHLGRALLRVSRNLPGRLGRKQPRGLPLAPPLFGFAPGGVCRAAPVAGRAVGSYPTLSPLPRVAPEDGHGGLLSVALSLGSPPPAVSRHRVSMEPGLSSSAAFRLSRMRPPGRLAGRIKGFARQNANEKAGMGCRLSCLTRKIRRASRPRPSGPSPCGNRPTTPDSSGSPHGRHCISGSCRRSCRRRDRAPWRDISCRI